jgi:hypothetical protein
MKRFLLAVLLLTATSAAWAQQWERFARDPDNTVVTYIMPTAVRWSGERGNRTVELWEMFDYRTVQEFGEFRFFSRQQKIEYSCSTERSRQLFFALFSEQMGSGQKVYSSNVSFDIGEWKPIIPGSVSESIWTRFCGKK